MTDKYYSILKGRLPCSDLEFELADRLLNSISHDKVETLIEWHEKRRNATRLSIFKAMQLYQH